MRSCTRGRWRKGPPHEPRASPQPCPTAPTVGALIASGTQCLTQAGVGFGHGTANAEDEATWLVLWQPGPAAGQRTGRRRRFNRKSACNARPASASSYAF